MNYFSRIVKKLGYLFNLYCLRDPFLISVEKWFADRGDEKLRLAYPLDQSSIVFDVGGYLGDFSEAIHSKYGCSVYLFEPVPTFYEACVARFKDNPSIVCLNYGLSSSSGWLAINLNNDESSFKKSDTGSATQKAEVRSFAETVSTLGVDKIDLIKINIEGGEFDLLPAMIDSGFIKRVGFLQVQFHNFVDGAKQSRSKIRESLSRTHREMWNYEFVWESWELR